MKTEYNPLNEIERIKLEREAIIAMIGISLLIGIFGLGFGWIAHTLDAPLIFTIWMSCVLSALVGIGFGLAIAVKLQRHRRKFHAKS